MAAASNTSIAAFAALGTIVGYLGAETACSSVFERQLWPARFYNTTSWRSLTAFALLMPGGGPIHKAAVEVLDTFAKSGLYKGFCRGDMLGTAFFKDTKQKYKIHIGQIEEDTGEIADARNAFWGGVLGLVPLHRRSRRLSFLVKAGGEEANRPRNSIRSQRPVFLLRLSWATEDEKAPQTVIDGDVGGVRLRYIIAILASEIITLAFGVAIMAVWRSPFAIWFLCPFLLKMLGLFVSVRREPLQAHPRVDARSNTPSDGEGGRNTLSGFSVYSMMEYDKGFMVLQGPSMLLSQFFKHYGHPIRHRRGLRSDRAREITSMTTVVLIALIYPVGLLIFIFARQEIQWTWLAYEIYTMFAMHAYRFCEGEWIGTTQYRIARELGFGRKVRFVNGGSQGVVASLEKRLADTVKAGMEEMNCQIDKALMANTT